jgi:hypothetical protein
MNKKILAVVVTLAVGALLVYAARSLDLVVVVRRMHGG